MLPRRLAAALRTWQHDAPLTDDELVEYLVRYEGVMAINENPESGFVAMSLVVDIERLVAEILRLRDLVQTLEQLKLTR